MHYRRFFDFSGHERDKTYGEHGLIEPVFFDDFLKEYGLIDSQIADVLSHFDAVIPEPFDVTTHGCESVVAQYNAGPHHIGADFDVLRSAVEALYPDDIKYFDLMSAGQFLYTTNMFVFKRELFEEYSVWLFSILDYVESSIDTSSYNTQQRRVIGYLAERLLTVFILKRLKNNPNLRVNEARRVFVQNTNSKPVAPLELKTCARHLPKRTLGRAWRKLPKSIRDLLHPIAKYISDTMR
jgi:Domain of unknown function (DUF4422)